MQSSPEELRKQCLQWHWFSVCCLFAQSVEENYSCFCKILCVIKDFPQPEIFLLLAFCQEINTLRKMSVHVKYPLWICKYSWKMNKLSHCQWLVPSGPLLYYDLWLVADSVCAKSQKGKEWKYNSITLSHSNGTWGLRHFVEENRSKQTERQQNWNPALFLEVLFS